MENVATNGFRNKIEINPINAAVRMGNPMLFKVETPAARDMINSFERARPTQKDNPDNITMIGMASRINEGDLVLANASAFVSVMPEDDKALMFSIVSTKNIRSPIIRNTLKNEMQNFWVKYQ